MMILVCASIFNLIAGGTSSAQSLSYHLVRSIYLPGDTGWDYIYDDSSLSRLFITRGSLMQIVNTKTGKLVGTVDGLSGIHGVTVDDALGRGFISNGNSNSVTVFDTKTMLKIGDDVPVDPGPDCIIFDPATQRVFTFNGESSMSTVIDAASSKVVGHITLAGDPEYSVADGKGFIFNNVEDQSEVEQIDAQSLKIVHVWPIAPGQNPSGIAMDRKNRRTFSVCRNGNLIVSNADTATVSTVLPIGNGPDAAAFDPKTGLVFSPNGRDGTLSICHEDNPDHYTLKQTVMTQVGARTMTLDTRTHHVFLVTARQLPPAPGAAPPAPRQRQRRRFALGSFVVLEYAP